MSSHSPWCPILKAPDVPQSWTPPVLLRALLRAGQYNTELRYARQPSWMYGGPLDWLLQHGNIMKCQSMPAHIPLLRLGYCYGNALVTALRHRLAYAEGYALLQLGNDPPHAFPHAWCLDAQKRVIEVTWPETGLTYFGNTFSIERANDATWNGNACILDDWHRGHPLLQQYWHGEQPDRVWPESSWLTLMRQGREQEAFAWSEAHQHDPVMPTAAR